MDSGHVHTDAFLFECVFDRCKSSSIDLRPQRRFHAVFERISVDGWKHEYGRVSGGREIQCNRNTSAHCSLRNGYVKEDSTKCQENISSKRFYLTDDQIELLLIVTDKRV